MRSSCEASATNWRSRSSEADFSLEGGLDLGQHRVEGGAEPSHLGGLVLGLDPAGEVPRGDGAGGAGHLVEGPQPPPDGPQGEDAQRGHHGQGDQELDAQQRGERGVGGVEGDGGDQRALGDGDGLGPVADARAGRSVHLEPVGAGLEGAALAAVGGGEREDLGPQRPRHDRLGIGAVCGPRGQRQRHLAPAVEDHDVDVGRDPLVERLVGGRHAPVGRPHQVPEGQPLGGADLGVQPAVEEGAQRGVGDDVGHGQADHQEHGHRDGEASVEVHVTPEGAAACSPPAARCG